MCHPIPESLDQQTHFAQELPFFVPIVCVCVRAREESCCHVYFLPSHLMRSYLPHYKMVFPLLSTYFLSTFFFLLQPKMFLAYLQHCKSAAFRLIPLNVYKQIMVNRGKWCSLECTNDKIWKCKQKSLYIKTANSCSAHSIAQTETHIHTHHITWLFRLVSFSCSSSFVRHNL